MSSFKDLELEEETVENNEEMLEDIVFLLNTMYQCRGCALTQLFGEDNFYGKGRPKPGTIGGK